MHSDNLIIISVVIIFTPNEENKITLEVLNLHIRLKEKIILSSRSLQADKLRCIHGHLKSYN